MPMVVVLLVALLAFFYLRKVRSARQQWLQKLDLPGRWLLVPSTPTAEVSVAETPAAEVPTAEVPAAETPTGNNPTGSKENHSLVAQQEELILHGSVREGEFDWVEEDTSGQRVSSRQGHWRVVGSSLELSVAGAAKQVWQLHLFKAGQIG